MNEPKKSTRLTGHELRNEGRLWDSEARCYVNGIGKARCSCGEQSKSLANSSQRKRWHRLHKDDIRSGGDGKVQI